MAYNHRTGNAAPGARSTAARACGRVSPHNHHYGGVAVGGQGTARGMTGGQAHTGTGAARRRHAGTWARGVPVGGAISHARARAMRKLGRRRGHAAGTRQGGAGRVEGSQGRRRRAPGRAGTEKETPPCEGRRRPVNHKPLAQSSPRLTRGRTHGRGRGIIGGHFSRARVRAMGNRGTA